MGGDDFLRKYPGLQTVPYKKLPDGTQLLADIYSPGSGDSNSITNRDIAPVVLFFHAGGLTAFSRKFINPSVVQAALSRGWTLVSVDYRLLPQASAEDILDDVKDAYRFATDALTGTVDTSSWAKGRDIARDGRRVIVAGASAGKAK